MIGLSETICFVTRNGSRGNRFHCTAYVGKAEWDMRTTKKLGWYFIGVGTRLRESANIGSKTFQVTVHS